MTARARAVKAGIVIALMIVAMLVTYVTSQQGLATYQARLYFQLAAASPKDKPALQTERDLLLSDTLLVQVLKDMNLLPPDEAPKFRSFDLGPDYKAQSEKIDPARLLFFRKNLAVRLYPDNSVMGIFYRSPDGNEAKKIVTTLFEKFSNWRQAGQAPEFNQRMIDADKNLSEKREAFLTSQKTFLDYIERNIGQSASRKSGDDLRAKKDELAATIAGLRLRYGPKHPVLIEALREQELLNRQGVDNNKAHGVVDKAKAELLRQRMEADFKSLDDAIRESVIVEQQKGGGAVPFKILPLGDAEVEILPRHTYLKTLMAGALTLILCLLYLLLRAVLRPTVDNGKKLKDIFGYQILARIPGLLKNGEGEIALPAGATADSVKALRQELKLRSWTSPIKLVTVTSTWPREGRSELIAALGRLSARAGEKVLILDADLRAPTLQQRMPLKAPRNLVDYLSGQARLEDIVIRTDPSGVHIIYGTAIPNTALDLLSSEKMKTLLASLRQAYDLVLVQAPVSLRGPDARVLGALSDQVLYVVEAAKTAKRDIAEGIASFTESGVRNLSFVLSEK